MGKVFDEIIGHVNRGKELMEKADVVNPRLANLALKGAVRELLQALEKLCNEVKVDMR